jgi:hypothetical protein
MPRPSRNALRKAASEKLISERAAYRWAVKTQLRAHKHHSGGFQLVEPRKNIVVAGPNFELTTNGVRDFCIGRLVGQSIVDRRTPRLSVS